MDISRDEASILKAISIVSVIMAHAYGWANIFEGIPIFSSYRIWSFFVQSGLTIFFFLSGYGVFQSFQVKGFNNYWNNKIEKIYFPAMVVQIIWLIILSFAGTEQFGIIEKGSALWGDILCISPENTLDGTMWFLSFLLLCYLSFYMFFRLLKSKYISLILFCVFWIVISPFIINIWKSVQYFIPAFAIGVMVSFAHTFMNYKFSKKIVIFGIIKLSMLNAIFIVFLFKKSVVIDIIADFLLALLFLLLIRIVGEKRLRILKWIGDLSFYIYLLEYKIIFSWFDYNMFSVGIRIVAFALLFVITVIASYCIKMGVKLIMRG